MIESKWRRIDLYDKGDRGIGVGQKEEAVFNRDRSTAKQRARAPQITNAALDVGDRGACLRSFKRQRKGAARQWRTYLTLLCLGNDTPSYLKYAYAGSGPVQQTERDNREAARGGS